MPRTSGQASVELVALLPLVALAAAALFQVALIGHAGWAASQAASAAARASAVGADPRRAARTALPPHLERGLGVTVRGDEVRVRLRPPALLPALAPGEVSARGHFEAQA
jgi:hypothetical protein